MKIADLHQDILFSNVDDAFDRLYESGYRVVFAAVFPFKNGKVWDFEETLEGVRWYKSRIGKFELVDRFNDLDLDNLNVVLVLEGCYLNSIEQYERLYNEGVRGFGLTWNVPSSLSGSCQDGKGLTELGREFLEWAREKRVLIDLAHASYEAIYQTCEVFKGAIYSHGGVLGDPKNMRNLNLEMANLIVQNGGVLGIGYGKLFFEKDVELEEVARHISWLLEMFPNSLVSGSDFYGLGPENVIRGLERPEDLPNLAKLLPKEHLENYLFKNFFNFSFNFGKTSSIKDGP